MNNLNNIIKWVALQAKTAKNQSRRMMVPPPLSVHISLSLRMSLSSPLSPMEPSHFLRSILLDPSGTSSRINKTNSDSLLSKLSSLDARTLTQELVFTLVHKTATKSSPLFSTRSFRITTDMARTPSMSLIWTQASWTLHPLPQRMPP